MAGTIKSKQQEVKDDLKNNVKLKPELTKFVIDMQRNKAAEVAKEKKKDDEFLLNSQEVIRRAAQLASKALLQDKIWKQVPPYLSMEWTRATSNDPRHAQEMHQDMAGFTTYLCREYNNFLKASAMGKGYPQPLAEENIIWFWAKFNADLRLLIEAEKRRVRAGNKSSIIDTQHSSDIVLPNGELWKSKN